MPVLIGTKGHLAGNGRRRPPPNGECRNDRSGGSALYTLPGGTWRSLVARSLWEREAAGSNPAVPTNGSPAKGTVLSDWERWAITRLERGLSPCQVVLDEQGREVDKWGSVVEREEPRR
jgi:hypothetical protein